jgi:hypothetical protein
MRIIGEQMKNSDLRFATMISALMVAGSNFDFEFTLQYQERACTQVSKLSQLWCYPFDFHLWILRYQTFVQHVRKTNKQKARRALQPNAEERRASVSGVPTPCAHALLQLATHKLGTAAL